MGRDGVAPPKRLESPAACSRRCWVQCYLIQAPVLRMVAGQGSLGRGCTKKPTAPSEGHEKRAKLKTKQAGKNKTMPTGCAKHFPQQLIRQQGHATDEWHTLGYAKEHRDRQLRAHHWISFGPPEPYPLAHQRLRSQLPRRRLFLQYRGVFLALAANSA